MTSKLWSVASPATASFRGPPVPWKFHRSIDWSASNVNVQVNELLRKDALQFLLAYQRDGNQVFGVHNDKHKPVEVAQQFAYMVSYYKALPEHLPEFYQ